MKLPQDIIFIRLSSVLPFKFAVRENTNLSVKRPVFFKAGYKYSSSAVIVSPEDVNSLSQKPLCDNNALFICTAPCDTKHIPAGCSLMVPDQEIDVGLLFNQLQAIFDLFEQWVHQLTFICHEEGTFQDLIDCSVAVTYNSLCLIDKDFRYIAYCRNSLKQGLVDAYVSKTKRVRPEVYNAIITDVNFASFYTLKRPFTSKVTQNETIAQNIFYHGTFVGRTLIECPAHDLLLVRYYSALLEILTPYAEKLYAKFKSFNQDDGFYNNIRRLIGDMLNNEHVPETAWATTLAESDWNRGDRLQLLQFRPNLRYDKNSYVKYTSAEIEERWNGCISIDYQGTLILLVNLDRFSSPDGKNFNQTLAYFLRDNLLSVGLSRIFTFPLLLPQAYHQTETALEFGTYKNPMIWNHSFDDYAFDYLLAHSTSQYDVTQVCSTKLLTLKKHDEQKDTDYYKTLLAYFSCSFNAAQAAKALYIHRSTFINRMDRIKELVHIDYDSIDELTYLYLSFRLLEEHSDPAGASHTISW